MRTTLDIEPDLLEEVSKLTGEKSHSKAVNKVLAEYIRRQKLEELRNLLGSMPLIDNWQELEELELEEMREQFC